MNFLFCLCIGIRNLQTCVPASFEDFMNVYHTLLNTTARLCRQVPVFLSDITNTLLFCVFLTLLDKAFFSLIINIQTL